MSAQRTSMHRLQELVRLHREGSSARAAARMLRMSRNTAQAYLGVFERAGLLEGTLDGLPELADLKRAIEQQRPERTPSQETSSAAPFEEQIRPMMVRGAGAKAIYDALRLDDPDFPASYDAVKRFCRKLRRDSPPRADVVALPVRTGPAEVAQVDFFYVGELLDPATGKERRCWAFVMLLAYSRHMFVDLVFDQKAETWQLLHSKAFAFFGGVPQVIVPDNLKAAVIQAAFNSSGDVALNRSYVAVARHYGFKIDPTPAYAPKKKGKVERAGRYFRDNYIRPREFADVHVARAGIRPWLLEIAGLRVHSTTGKKPLVSFEEEERALLLPLPDLHFAPVIWHQATVHADCHVQFRRHLYSVPWRLITDSNRKRVVWLRVCGSSVVVYADEERVATHALGKAWGRTTAEGHLPPQREQWCNRTRVYWEERAAELGDEVFTYVCELFEDDDVLLPLRKVQAIVTFLQGYPRERREAACRRARFFGVAKVRPFKDILRKDLDLQPLPDGLLPHAGLEKPQFARGAAAFMTATPEAK